MRRLEIALDGRGSNGLAIAECRRALSLILDVGVPRDGLYSIYMAVGLGSAESLLGKREATV
jgi:hypothetical protein